MSASESAPPPSSDLTQYELHLIEWRKRCFLRMGFDDEWSLALSQAAVDHHKVHRMLQNGCTHTLACSIML